MSVTSRESLIILGQKMERIENGGREDRRNGKIFLGSLASKTNESIIVEKEKKKKKQVEC